MNSNFEKVLNEIKNIEIANKQKLNKIKHDSRKSLEDCSEKNSSARAEKIKKINADIETHYEQEKQKIEKDINIKKLEIDKEILNLKFSFDQKKEKAVNELFNEFSR